MTPYSLLLDRCGLSLREAADFHGVRLDTVKSWSAGRNRAPEGAIIELRDLYGTIERLAAERVKRIKAAKADVYSVSFSPIEAELSYEGAQTAMIGIVVSRLNIPVDIKED